jgi:hypothetical protein
VKWGEVGSVAGCMFVIFFILPTLHTHTYILTYSHVPHIYQHTHTHTHTHIEIQWATDAANNNARLVLFTDQTHHWYVCVSVYVCACACVCVRKRVSE